MVELRKPAVLWALSASMALACTSSNDGGGGANGVSSADADGGAGDAGNRATAILAAELQRDRAAVTDDDLTSRDAPVRRAATRALSRFRDPDDRARLLARLHDEDPAVVAWAAYGLGEVCAGAREKTVEVLATRSASWEAHRDAESGPLVPQRAITRAVGRCATDQAEQLLVSWALRRDGFTGDAIDALGDVARKNKRLREETYVALLKLADEDATAKALPAAFYPIGQAEHLRTPSVIERTQKLATEALAVAGPNRVYAIRALGRCDDQAVPVLQRVLEANDFSAIERVEAARNLARFGRAGQDALAAALDKLVASDPKALMSTHLNVVLAVLDNLTIFKKARPSMQKLAELAVPADADLPLLRRASWIRCTAAKLLAEREYQLPLLRGCDLLLGGDVNRAEDPLPSSIGARAVVTAIGVDAVKITGPRLAAWRSYALGGDLRAREDALRLIGTHDELDEAPQVLTTALEASEPGLVATALEVILEHPRRVKSADAVHPKVAEAIVKRLDGTGPSADLEVWGLAIQATGKLGLEAGKARLVELCASPYSHLRKLAETSLAALMGRDSPSCQLGPPLAVPVELERALTSPTTIELATDVGKLTLLLDPALTPVAATRMVDLAKNGFYDGMVVHRVVPGFVVQFGSPTFDSYGGVKSLPTMPCETSPTHFGPGTVGIALAGRDSGSSQLFVTLASTPHLDGAYAQIGRAEGPWDALVDGDLIQKARVLE